MKSALVLSCLAALAITLSGCGTAPAPKDAAPMKAETSFFAMDTYISMTAYGEGGAKALQNAQNLITDAERRLSVTDTGSEIYRLNHRAGDTAEVSEETAALLRFALHMADETGGALDPAIYPVLTAWGFTTDHHQIPPKDTLDALLPLVDYHQIELKDHTVTLPKGMEIDFGAIAKGYSGQQAADLVRRAGISSAILNLGGNVQAIGEKPDGSLWRVGLQSPWGHDYLGILSIKDLAVVTSGSYERFFVGEDGRTYHHIINPKTGYPADNGLVSVTIIGPDGGLCDALSTALFVMGPEKAAAYWRNHKDFDMILVTGNHELFITPSIQDRFQLDPAFANLKVTVLS